MFTNIFVDKTHQQNITAQALIMTKQPVRELSDVILKGLARGVTVWQGKGAYTGDDVHILCVCLSKYEIETLQTMVHEIDPHAFITVQEGVHTIGNFQRHLN